ncbi:MAG: B12-binding domain-containing radical SAM protein, partial [Desulfobacterota bacterium]|nr:B12-binding domain-containing radical SAM protein [Thermodesulfobacteriota bacterium]
MKLLLINPKVPESFWSFKWALDKILSNKRVLNPPLGLATLAALCPPHWEVEIIDENIESIPLAPQANIIGVGGMGVQFHRQKELLTFYRKKGYYVVAGGSYASLCPEVFEQIADTVIAGEAEYIWKDFCRDFEYGTPKKLYHETGIVDLKDSPVPRFDLLKLDKYKKVSLQFSRGCPYRCEFCDIIVMFGRKFRAKAPEQIGKELDLLRRLGVNNVFFVDDNLIGNKRVTKELLRFLKAYQLEHNYQFQFGTEASLDLAQDDELLKLLREAHFEWVFIGIESPDEESLKETKKLQNTRQNILSAIRKIYSYGIEVLAGFIIGFDNDNTKTFDRQYQFIMDSGIQAAMIGLLTALPKTPLYERLKKEGRLIPESD